VTKTYGDGFRAVTDLNLDVRDGEFVVFVGPSGCGKTTALRMIAGLEEISDGEIRIGDRVVNNLPPGSRDVAMVFQNYALYPHMTVAENIGFSLRMHKVPKPEQRQRIAETAKIIGLEDHLNRKPRQLSGGQRQRVAMGRAIVREPQVFLMDEPLSNLDAKLRAQTRSEIRRLQHEVGTTTVYVTHDQVEAMTMGDRIATMRDGVLEQVGDPDSVYRQPANTFVASFIGSPAMSLARCGCDRSNGAVQLKLGEQRLALEGADEIPDEVIVGVRPEHTRLWDAEQGLLGPLEGRVEYVESLGRETLIAVAAPGDTRFVVEAEGNVRAEPGEAVRFGLRRGWVYRFDATDERALGRV
jgi:multiple sugar transport system ATP-binding protein